MHRFIGYKHFLLELSLFVDQRRQLDRAVRLLGDHLDVVVDASLQLVHSDYGLMVCDS